MNYIIYISAASHLMSEAELLEILTASRDSNKAKNITGMLIYSDGTFIQVLEGDEYIINTVYKKIGMDPRHKNLIKLAEGDLKKRNFPDWNMGFITVNAQVLDELEGYINPTNKNFLETNNPHAAISVLKTFVQNNRLSPGF